MYMPLSGIFVRMFAVTRCDFDVLFAVDLDKEKKLEVQCTYLVIFLFTHLAVLLVFIFYRYGRH